MRRIPKVEDAPILRTDFSDERAWEQIKSAVAMPTDGFVAYVTYIDDVEYDGLTTEQLPEAFGPGANRSFVIVADALSMRHPEHPLLVVDLFDESLQSFRAVPRTIQSIENNLSLANMDFEDFSEVVDAEGIHRGFPTL